MFVREFTTAHKGELPVECVKIVCPFVASKYVTEFGLLVTYNMFLEALRAIPSGDAPIGKLIK